MTHSEQQTLVNDLLLAITFILMSSNQATAINAFAHTKDIVMEVWGQPPCECSTCRMARPQAIQAGVLAYAGFKQYVDDCDKRAVSPSFDNHLSVALTFIDSHLIRRTHEGPIYGGVIAE